MPHAIWKGAVVFGFVHIPVGLYSGAKEAHISLHWLDRRDWAPVGYHRINKKTGEEVQWEDIVNGYEYEKGKFVIVTDDDITRANPKSTQTIEIESFVPAASIPSWYFQTPYRLLPEKTGEKGYVLLREVLKREGKAGIAKIVMHNKQHLAAVLPQDDILMLETLRFEHEFPDQKEDDVHTDVKNAAPGAKELQMATNVIADMSGSWDSSQYKDTYQDDLMARIKKKIDAGQTHAALLPGDEKGTPADYEPMDLMAALKKSLGGNRKRLLLKPAVAKAGSKAKRGNRPVSARIPAHPSANLRKRN